MSDGPMASLDELERQVNLLARAVVTQRAEIANLTERVAALTRPANVLEESHRAFEQSIRDRAKGGHRG